MTHLEKISRQPSFLYHPYAQVVCTTRAELTYVIEWARSKGKLVGDGYSNYRDFPIHLFLEGDVVGWTNSTDRVGDKYSFLEFIKIIES